MRVYKENKESKGTVTIIYNPKVSTDSYDEMLKELSKITDLFFVFSREESLKIKTRKFTNLYEATYYGIQEGNESESELIYTALDYTRELGSYVGFFVLFNEIGKDLFAPIKKLNDSLIETSVFSRRRLGAEEIQSIYKRENNAFYNRILGMFSFDFSRDTSRMYETYTTEDSIIFLREITLRKLEENFEQFKLYHKSFKESSFQTFISSAIERFCPETTLNAEIIYAKV